LRESTRTSVVMAVTSLLAKRGLAVDSIANIADVLIQVYDLGYNAGRVDGHLAGLADALSSVNKHLGKAKS
jgi:hypothetical protein